MPTSLYYIYGKIVDHDGRTMPEGTNFTISALDSDSIVLWKQSLEVPEFTLGIPKSGDYIIRCEGDGYLTTFKNVSVTFGRRETRHDVGHIMVERIPFMDGGHLGVVEVKATKLKFYFDKDTIVYDAGAFTTQSGLVLSEILNKMPGLDVRENGEIYSNGRKVDEMLLNGKDFFNRDRTTILNNLPAFMVKDVKVFEKETGSNQHFDNTKVLAMDIRLKKQYESFTLGNLGLGLGTDERFHTQGFGLSYTPFRRVSGYVLSNNISKDDTYVNGSLHSKDDNGGNKTWTKAGVKYNIVNPRGLYDFSGDITTKYSDEFFNLRTGSSPLLGNGTLYKRMSEKVDRYAYSIQTSHTLRFNGKRNNLTFTPSFSYDQSKQLRSTLSGMFGEDLAGTLGEAWEDSLSSSFLRRTLEGHGIYGAQSNRKDGHNGFRSSVGITYDIHIPHSDDVLTLGMTGTGSSESENAYDHRYVECTSGEAQTHENGNQRAWRRKKETSLDIYATYHYIINRHNKLLVNLQQRNRKERESRTLYVMPEEETGEPESFSESFPAYDFLMSKAIVDTQNTYKSKELVTGGSMTLTYEYELQCERSSTNLKIDIPFDIDYRRMEYRGECDTLFHRSMCLPAFRFDLKKNFVNPEKNRNLSISIGYRLSHSMPGLLELIDTDDTSQLLYVRRGNPHLKNQHNHAFSLGLSLVPARFSLHSLTLGYTFIRNQTVSATSYDMKTGVTRSMPVSVNGFHAMDFAVINQKSILQDRSLGLSHMLSGRRNVYVGFTGMAEELSLTRYKVRNLSLTDRIGVSKTLAGTKISVGASLYVTYNRTASSLPSYETQNSFDYGIRLNPKMELPHGFKLMTTLTSVSRRGYSHESMNKDKVLWNVSVTKSFGEVLSLELTGDDILGQRTNVFRFANMQGLTETYVNNLRQYLMLHALWKFNAKKHAKHAK